MGDELMRILVVTNMYPYERRPHYGVFVREQAESLRKEGVEVEVFFINGAENRVNYFTSISGLYAKLRATRFDIIHAHHTYCLPAIHFAQLFLGRKHPVVLTFHEAEALRRSEVRLSDMDTIRKLVYSKGLKQVLLKGADFVVYVCRDLFEALNLKIESAVLPCGVDLDLFFPQDQEACKERLNLPADKRILFFPADPNRYTHKGYLLFQRALAIMDREDLHVLTGGHIAHEQMVNYMGASDVVIQTSNFEASPMVIKEAMACNIPIVSTDVGDTKDVMGETKGCYISDKSPEDVANKVEKALLFNTRTNGRDRIMDLGLGLQQVTQRLIRIYADIVKY